MSVCPWPESVKIIAHAAGRAQPIAPPLAIARMKAPLLSALADPVGCRPERRRLLVAAVAAAVAVAFADSSIVVLALPAVYGAFDTSIVGVSWVITAYNLVVAVVAFALVPLVGRVDVGRVSRRRAAALLRRLGRVGRLVEPARR